jgi:hypothetical protein
LKAGGLHLESVALAFFHGSGWNTLKRIMNQSFVALYCFGYPRGCMRSLGVQVLCCVWTFVVAPWVRESFGSCSLSVARFCNLAVDGSDYRRGRNLFP